MATSVTASVARAMYSGRVTLIPAAATMAPQMRSFLLLSQGFFQVIILPKFIKLQERSFNCPPFVAAVRAAAPSEPRPTTQVNRD